ncbi:MAG TPA: hypothetical protein VK400_01250 [Pyrinomonadaceae bacterium]|nr:hypothetical protein [Pyrinomonadaceae bacterium]
MKYLFLILLFVLTLTAAVTAQLPQPQAIAPRVTAEIIAGSSTAVVKGAPFSAEAISESTQVLADGNKISRTFTVRMYRDGDGRFRREQVPASTGASGIVSVQTISIFDPVANFRYFLDPDRKTVRRMPVPAGSPEGVVIANGHPMSPAVRAQIETTAGQKNHVLVLPGAGASSNTGKSESLGTRNFEGLEAEGTRTVTTIPAGTIGNERAIEIVYEKWYSKELQLIVYSKHTDPRFGEQIYRLDNINRSEPDRSLFTPPADYKVISEPTYNVITPRPVMVPRTPGIITTTRPQ